MEQSFNVDVEKLKDILSENLKRYFNVHGGNTKEVFINNIILINKVCCNELQSSRRRAERETLHCQQSHENEIHRS
jgi:hypothetical protein